MIFEKRGSRGPKGGRGGSGYVSRGRGEGVNGGSEGVVRGVSGGQGWSWGYEQDQT